ncbi:6-phosphofructokinase [bacterium]|nr:6-phosphofructokinase [bacterium]MBU0899590.1 6-phosphofructokinase [bacterium]MBU1153915.1 6-phosphofructokinase [bacterium]MBU2600466.1 6-phosphofructokinase [bacterium]
MKRIGILTRDCAGVNACLRAVVRMASYYQIKVIGIIREYEGLINNETKILTRSSVSGIINLGGTILKTSRSKEFLTPEGQEKAIKTIKDNDIEGLIIVGGNGTLAGAHLLATKYSLPVIGVPATIDNDVNGVDLTIGTDTAVNVALDALDKIRDTATSLERIFVVEVMGRNCGYLALRVALAGGCEEVLLPERKFNIEEMCQEIALGNTKGKISWIIVVAEGKAKATEIAQKITEITNLETRVTILGHIQRGGRPTALDRIIATRMGSYAVEALKEGETDKCIIIKDDKLSTIPLAQAIKPKDIEVESYYKLIKFLA